MAVVAIAILISFHLKHQPTELERYCTFTNTEHQAKKLIAISRKIALPFGLLFWFLALACLVSGLTNYIKTVNRYSRRQALVQSGPWTQVVSLSPVWPVGSSIWLTSTGVHCGGVCDRCGLYFVLKHECTGKSKAQVTWMGVGVARYDLRLHE